jgi:hypothetical protein
MRNPFCPEVVAELIFKHDCDPLCDGCKVMRRVPEVGRELAKLAQADLDHCTDMGNWDLDT